jgi:Zn-dependent alcohol dehydrogenase
MEIIAAVSRAIGAPKRCETTTLSDQRADESRARLVAARVRHADIATRDDQIDTISHTAALAFDQFAGAPA